MKSTLNDLQIDTRSIKISTVEFGNDYVFYGTVTSVSNIQTTHTPKRKTFLKNKKSNIEIGQRGTWLRLVDSKQSTRNQIFKYVILI